MKLPVLYLDVFLLLMKAEFGARSVELIYHNPGNEAIGRYLQQGLLHAIAHSLWNASQDDIAGIDRLLIGCQRKSLQLFLQPGLAEKIAQGRAKIV